MYISIREIVEYFAWIAAIVVGGFGVYLISVFLYCCVLIIPAALMAALQGAFKFNPPLPTFEELDYLIRHVGETRMRDADERRLYTDSWCSQLQ